MKLLEKNSAYALNLRMSGQITYFYFSLKIVYKLSQLSWGELSISLAMCSVLYLSNSRGALMTCLQLLTEPILLIAFQTDLLNNSDRFLILRLLFIKIRLSFSLSLEASKKLIFFDLSSNLIFNGYLMDLSYLKLPFLCFTLFQIQLFFTFYRIFLSVAAPV